MNSQIRGVLKSPLSDISSVISAKKYDQRLGKDNSEELKWIMDIELWIRQVKHLLNELHELDVGYPLGKNEVYPPAFVEVVSMTLTELGVDDLLDFYCHCNGFSLPDIHVGYFMKPIELLRPTLEKSDPIRVSGICCDVLSIGSTGGGGHFVMRKQQRDVLLLPPGPIHDGVYEASDSKIKVIGATFTEFLHAIKRDIRAFVKDTSMHSFIA